MSSRMEQIIEEIEEYIDGCKYQALSNTKIIVNKEQLMELLTDLRLKTPEEVKGYKRMLNNREAILADAQKKAEEIVAEAQKYTTELISEHQIMQQAYAQANEIVMVATNQAQEILDNATRDANEIRMGAMMYTDEILKELENMISQTMDDTKKRTESLLVSLQDCCNMVNMNRKELFPQEEPQETEEEPEDSLNSDMLEE